MNKLLTKVVGVALGLGLAVGVGAGVTLGNKNIRPAYAATATVASTSYSSGAFTGDLSWTATGGTDKGSYYLMNDNSSAQIVSAAFSASDVDLTKSVTFTLNTRTFGGTSFNTSNIVAYSDSSFANSISTTCSIVASDKNLADKTGTLSFNNNVSPTNIYFKITSSTTSGANGPGIAAISFTYTQVVTGNTYTVTTTVTNGTYSGDTQIIENDNASVTISPNAGYKLPDSVTVTGATHSYNSSTGVISLSNPTGNVSISATMVAAAQYTITTSLIGLTASGDTNVYENGTATVTLSVVDANTKALPTEITVENAVDYSYNSSTGVVAITGATGNVLITASAINKPSEEEEGFVFAADHAGWTEESASSVYSKTVDLITVTWEKNTGFNIGYWNPARLYNNHTVTITATTGVGAVNTIKSIIINANSATYATNTANTNVTKAVTKPTITPGSLTATADDKVVTINASGTVTEVVLTIGSTQVRWDSITVVYEKDQTEVPLTSISATCNNVLVSQQVSPVITWNPTNTSNKRVTYEIVENTSSLAEVDSNGVVTGKGNGTARLKIVPEAKPSAAITIDVVVNSLPNIYGVEIGKRYAMTAELNSKTFELESINTSGNYPYGFGAVYTSNPLNTLPVRVVNGLYAKTVALEVTINSATKYLMNDPNDSNNNLNVADSIDRTSSWIFAEEEAKLVIRNVATYGRKLGATTTTNNDVTTYRFACYQNLSNSVITPTFVEIQEVKTDKECVQDFVDLYLHMSDYNSNLGYCKDGEHSYYLTAKAGFNALTPAQQSLFQSDSDFDAAQARYEAWAEANNDAAPYDGNDTIVTTLRSNISAALVFNNDTSAVMTFVIITIVLVTSTGAIFLLRKKKEER